jgi:hypothetical protein
VDRKLRSRIARDLVPGDVEHNLGRRTLRLPQLVRDSHPMVCGLAWRCSADGAFRGRRVGGALPVSQHKGAGKRCAMPAHAHKLGPLMARAHDVRYECAANVKRRCLPSQETLQFALAVCEVQMARGSSGRRRLV